MAAQCQEFLPGFYIKNKCRNCYAAKSGHTEESVEAGKNSKENEVSAGGVSYEMEEMAGAAEPTKAHLVSKVAKKVVRGRIFSNVLKILLLIGIAVTIALLVTYRAPSRVYEGSGGSQQSNGESVGSEDSGSTAGAQAQAQNLLGNLVSNPLLVGVREDSSLQDCLTGGMKQTFPDIDYSLYGYNVLKGYPLADGRDPGFTRPLFAFDFSSGGHTADCRYSLPKGLTAAPDVACRTSFTSKTVSNSQELKKSLNVNAQVSGGGWGVSFSASTDYKQASSTVEKGETKIIQSTASCKYYFTKLNQLDMPELSPEMLAWVQKMKASINQLKTIDDNLIYDFVDYFGTHFPNNVVYGARFTYESKVSTSSYESLKSSDLSVEAKASYSGLFSLSGGFGMSTSQQDAAKNFQESSETSTLSVGAPPPYNGDAMTWASTVKDTPVPVQYALVPIYELFDSKFTAKQYFDKQTTRKIRDKIMSIASSYCRKASDKGLDVQCDDDSIIKFQDLEMVHYNTYDRFNLSLTSCLEECLKRSYCVMLSLWPKNSTEYISGKQCGLDDDDEATRALRSCKNCKTFIVPHALKRSIKLNGYKYDSTVTRRNLLKVPSASTSADLTHFCSVHCSLDDQCIGFEISSDLIFNYNCATYSQHSEHLVIASDFETNIMTDLAKRLVLEQQVNYLVTFTSLLLPVISDFGEGINECNSECCQSRCTENVNCISFVQLLASNVSMCYQNFGGENLQMRFNQLPSETPVRVGIFPERFNDGLFKVTGIWAWSNGDIITEEIADDSDSCSDMCSNDINCIFSSWNALNSTCTIGANSISHFLTAAVPHAQSMMVFSNTKERIRKFKAT